MSDPELSEERWSLGQALRLAPVVPALTNVVVVLSTWRLPTAGVHIRALHLFFTSAELVAIGLLLGAFADFGARFLRSKPNVKRAALFVVTAAVAFVVFEEDTLQLGVWAQAGVAGGAGACAALVPSLATLCKRWWPLRGVVFAGAVAAAIANHFALRINYPGAHLALGVASIVGVALGLVGLRKRVVLPAWGGHVVLGLACLMGAGAVVHRPSGTVALEMARDESSPLYRFVAPLRGSQYASSLSAIAPEARAWFTSREAAPPVPPWSDRPVQAKPVVFLLTVDALRYDFWADPQNAKYFPHLKRLASQSVEFQNAHSTGSTTVPSVSSLHSGLYYSQRYWTRTPFRRGQRFFLTRDTETRLCDYLTEAGVETATAPTTTGLMQAFGIVSGCKTTLGSEPGSTRYSEEVVPLLVEWAKANGPGRAFVYAHFMDGHDPYDRVAEGTDRERQLGESAMVDEQIGLLLKELRGAGLWHRTVVIITADHGESHGDHGAQFHGANLYEELTRVPMLIRVPGVKPRTFSLPVSGIDVTPTLLDLFDLPVPGKIMGQSLLPLLLGADVQLTRPIVLDSSKQQRALLFPDGIKVIHKARESSFEIYDLNTDPGETNNLVDDFPEAEARIGALVAFFEAHSLRKFGYRIPPR